MPSVTAYLVVLGVAAVVTYAGTWAMRARARTTALINSVDTMPPVD